MHITYTTYVDDEAKKIKFNNILNAQTDFKINIFNNFNNS